MLFRDTELFASNPLTILCSTAVSNIRFVKDWKLLTVCALLREKQGLYPQGSENAALSRDRDQEQKYHLAIAALPAFPCHIPKIATAHSCQLADPHRSHCRRGAEAVMVTWELLFPT